MPKKNLYLIDGAGFYFRAFYGIRERLTNAKGVPTNAVYGFARMLRKILKEKNPDYVVMALDSRGKTFRHEQYAMYKANRPQMPDDLAVQLPFIDRLIEGYNMPMIRIPGWEADDIIGTIAVKAVTRGLDVVIVSSDKDLAQIVSPSVCIFDPMKDKQIGIEQVIEKFGVAPEKVVDILGLMGDASDNIPGVPGVGAKTAKALVGEYGDMESVLAGAEGMRKKKLKANLLEFAEQARLSKKLATIALDAPIAFEPDKWKTKSVDGAKLKTLFTELGFTTMIKGLEPSAPQAERRYKTILDQTAFEKMLGEMKRSNGFAVDVETTSKNPMRAKLVGISFCAIEARAWYLPLRHGYEDAPEQLSLEKIFQPLKELLEDESIPKFGQNIKYDMIVLSNEGFNVKPVRLDTMIAASLLDPTGRNNLETLAMKTLGQNMTAYSDVCGSGAKQITFDKVPIETAADYSAEDADVTYKLAKRYLPMIEREGFSGLMEDVETPLIDVLVSMERNGALVDEDALKQLSITLGDDAKYFEERIYDLAGEVFNINSPKQLAVILFEKLKLPHGRKTKTGFSTGQSVLENLAGRHELPKLILEYRSVAKLKNTYADALPKSINDTTGRIHTSFNQAGTATGRLSSSDPNLQNIPARTQAGRRIRKAFIAPDNCSIVSADYSQIELRLLAHYSKEKVLLDAFKNGEDIHSATAAEIFDVARAFVTREMRQVAKTVNFGVIYGQSAFGLAGQLKIPLGEAKKYIDNYFRRHPGISGYIKKTIDNARDKGYVTTILGRVRPLPEITSANRRAREFAERNAVNTPMQGSAADLIKMAMINIDRIIRNDGYKTKMILQVHDELVFETPDEEVEQLMAMVKQQMENVWELSVPLTVDIQHGANWDEAH